MHTAKGMPKAHLTKQKCISSEQL